MYAPFEVWTLVFLSTFCGDLDVCFGEVSQQSPMARLRERLLKNYSTVIRPVRNHENTTVITISIQPLHIVLLDEKQGILYLDTQADISWEDQNLQWDPQEYSGIKQIFLPPTQIWRPDVRIYNSRSFRTAPWAYMDLIVDNKGKVSWSPPASMALVCDALDYSLYPDDVQSCWLELGCWLESKNEIDFAIQDIDPLMNIYMARSPYWAIESYKGQKFEFMDANNETNVAVAYDMELRRIHVPHSYLGSVPDAVARVLILCIFWLPGLAKKLWLGCLTLVLLTNIAINVTELLPSPAALPFALRETSAALEMCMAAIILEMVVCFLPFLDVASPVILDRLSKMRALQMITTGTSRPLIEEDQEGIPPESPKPKEASNHWAFLGILIDRVAFVIFAVLLLAV